MSGYTPVFDTVFHGTLCGKWPTLPVWLTMLPMADKNGHIDMTPQAISALTGWPVDLLKQAIDELTQPDTESRSTEEGGRRLVLIDPENRSWGWRVVNHERYRERARLAAKNAREVASGAAAERMRVRRCSPPTASQTQTHTQTQEEETHAPELKALRETFPKRSGSQPWDRAKKACNARLAEGHTWQQILSGVGRYAEWCAATGKIGTETVMQAATFCGPEKHFLESWDRPAAPSVSAETLALSKLKDRRAAIGLPDFRDPLPGENSKAYAAAQDAAWAKLKAESVTSFGAVLKRVPQ